MSPAEMTAVCSHALRAGLPTITMSLPAGIKWPQGFPRGTLLSVNPAGLRNYAIDPAKVLAWLRAAEPAPQRMAA